MGGPAARGRVEAGERAARSICCGGAMWARPSLGRGRKIRRGTTEQKAEARGCPAERGMERRRAGPAGYGAFAAGE